jgi:fumarylpyruvate hydrolase
MPPAYVFEPGPRPALAVAGTSALFPVRRVFCIGRNYAAHTREMGGDPNREPPFFFMKPADALDPVPEGVETPHPYPPGTASYHHEVEMVVALSGGGRDIAPADAQRLIFGYAVGFDMTRRDVQDEAKALRRPWEIAKAADRSGPVGPLHQVSAIGHPASGAITLAVNGSPRQAGDLADMIWSVPEQIAILSRFWTIEPGDVIFSGTPEGVGAVARGDLMEASVAGLGTIRLRVG